MEEREENSHERLKQQLKELEKEWTDMKTGKKNKNSSAVSRITVEEVVKFVENSPRKLMLSLQHEPEAEMIQIGSPLRRKLFHDSDDDDGGQTKKTTSFSHSSCWSSTSDTRKSKKKKMKIGRIVSAAMVLLLLYVLFVLMNSFDHFSVNTHINTLVPT